MSQPTHQQIATYLTDYALSELVKYVMEDTFDDDVMKICTIIQQ